MPLERSKLTSVLRLSSPTSEIVEKGPRSSGSRARAEGLSIATRARPITRARVIRAMLAVYRKTAERRSMKLVLIPGLDGTGELFAAFLAALEPVGRQHGFQAQVI